ncbi:hypothetical protein HK100_001922 [Physocladia obscura]|uniref:Uncharacterized protein n=1 Tax=Physocladia obscura TaxID=109957 RepID=A0AAD5XBG6_9FUNG|nr:hypothetical protein HK100_001922 [Physocladia obscura]
MNFGQSSGKDDAFGLRNRTNSANDANRMLNAGNGINPTAGAIGGIGLGFGFSTANAKDRAQETDAGTDTDAAQLRQLLRARSEGNSFSRAVALSVTPGVFTLLVLPLFFDSVGSFWAQCLRAVFAGGIIVAVCVPIAARNASLLLFGPKSVSPTALLKTFAIRVASAIFCGLVVRENILGRPWMPFARQAP